MSFFLNVVVATVNQSTHKNFNLVTSQDVVFLCKICNSNRSNVESESDFEKRQNGSEGLFSQNCLQITHRQLGEFYTGMLSTKRFLDPLSAQLNVRESYLC